MRISLTSPARKISLALAFVLMAAVYLLLVARQFGAAYFSQRADLAHLQRSVRWEPGNADYRHHLGRYFFLVERSPEAAVESYRAAIALNPFQARYWFDLAAAYQFLGNTDAQKEALEHGLVADPKTPDLAWEAGNFYLAQAEPEKALQQFRVVMENYPPLTIAALKLSWRVKPDIEFLLRDIVPATPPVYTAFLDFLVAQKQTVAAARVWTELVEMRQPVAPALAFVYVRFLVAQHEVDQARIVWQQASALCGLSAYQPSSENLIVNGDFSLNVLNGGFDWQYRQSREISLALDPTQSHSGHRSLLITFDAQKAEDAGIAQLVPVLPSTKYDFSAYFKSENIEGAGGPRFAVQDLYNETTFFASDELKNADFWKEVNGDFTTGPDTRLVLVHIRREPPGMPIRGKLWIDTVRLVAQESGPDSGKDRL
jgi:tetratricopeptide (TPR) repeat protein